MRRRAGSERRICRGSDHVEFNTYSCSPLLYAALLTAASAHAWAVDERGFQAGDFMIRVRAIGVIREDTSSNVSLTGGNVTVRASPAPEVDLSYVFTDHIAAELIAAGKRHEISASSTALRRVDIGTTYIQPPNLALQHHFLLRRFIDPRLGAGLNVPFWYDLE